MNERMTYAEFNRERIQYMMSSPAVITEFSRGRLYYMGKLVIDTGKEIVLYDKCKYCGVNNPQSGLYGMRFCGSCGAPIS